MNPKKKLLLQLLFLSLIPVAILVTQHILMKEKVILELAAGKAKHVEQKHVEVITSDGGTSVFKITNPPTQRTILFQIDNPEISSEKIAYKTKIRPENLEGEAFIEMLCYFKNKGEFFSRALTEKITGTDGWKETETYFHFTDGLKPESIRLNVIIEGKGTVYVDTIFLYQTLY